MPGHVIVLVSVPQQVYTARAVIHKEQPEVVLEHGELARGDRGNACTLRGGRA
jgi:hypothetical protein